MTVLARLVIAANCFEDDTANYIATIAGDSANHNSTIGGDVIARRSRKENT
jgi:hypothetical protein